MENIFLSEDVCMQAAPEFILVTESTIPEIAAQNAYLSAFAIRPSDESEIFMVSVPEDNTVSRFVVRFTEQNDKTETVTTDCGRITFVRANRLFAPTSRNAMPCGNTTVYAELSNCLAKKQYNMVFADLQEFQLYVAFRDIDTWQICYVALVRDQYIRDDVLELWTANCGYRNHMLLSGLDEDKAFDPADHPDFGWSWDELQQNVHLSDELKELTALWSPDEGL